MDPGCVRECLRRIVDDVWRAVAIEAFGEISRPFQCRGHRETLGIGRRLNVPFGTDPEERLAAAIVKMRNYDRPAQGRSPVVIRAVGPRNAITVSKEVVCKPGTLARLAEHGAMNDIRAGSQKRIENTAS